MRIFSCQLGDLRPPADEDILGCARTALVIWVPRSGSSSSSGILETALVALGCGLGSQGARRVGEGVGEIASG